MILTGLDWAIIAAYFAFSLAVGLAVTRRAGSNTAEFFGAGRQMPWWLLGISMVATTFSTDTPNLVTDIVRRNGVSGNWVWWAFLLNGMLTVFVYARLWKRCGVLTDVEFYELRYSGRSAAFLRGFRAIYLGLVFNTMIMATVSLAAIKIGTVLLGIAPWKTLVVSGIVTVIYSSFGGLRSVLFTDLVQFIIAMAGSVTAAVVALRLPQVGGLSGLFSHPEVTERLSLLPDFSDPGQATAVFLIPLAVQWWSVWYPGAEPGGGGYVAQRMLASKSEDHAVGAVFLFNVAHYALRPWPWIIVALCSIVVFPELKDLETAFPSALEVMGHDMAYPAMLTFLPAGLIGLLLSSLAAAYMSTISTHLNWGSSYLVHDFYRRFLRPAAEERELVLAGRLATVALMALAGLLALFLDTALDSFQIILQIGAGTGLLFILRWFWWRISAVSEIAAMTASFLIALYFQFLHEALGFSRPESWTELTLGVGITTVVWVAATFLSRPTAEETLRYFVERVRPGGPGWRKFESSPSAAGAWGVPRGILLMMIGSAAVYSLLFGTGLWIYGHRHLSLSLIGLGFICFLAVFRMWRSGERPH